MTSPDHTSTRRGRSVEELRRDARISAEQLAPQHAHRRLRDLIQQLDKESEPCPEH